MDLVGLFVFVVAVLAVLAAAGWFMSARVVRQIERGVVFRLGRAQSEVRQPGLTMLVPLVDRMTKVNVQVITLPVPAQDGITALLGARSDPSRAIDWIQIGAIAGPVIELPSVAFRSANFRLQGSGQGAVSPAGYLAELPALVQEISAGTIAVTARPVPLADVQTCWTAPGAPGVRTVLVP